MRAGSLRAYWFERPNLFRLPLIALALAVFLWARPDPFPPVHASLKVERIQGVTGAGQEFMCQHAPLRRDVHEFCIWIAP